MLLCSFIYSLHLVIWGEGCSSFNRFSSLEKAGGERANHCWLLGGLLSCKREKPLGLLWLSFCFLPLWLQGLSTMIRICWWLGAELQFAPSWQIHIPHPAMLHPQCHSSCSACRAVPAPTQLFVGHWGRSVLKEQLWGHSIVSIILDIRAGLFLNADFLKLLRSGSG